MIKTINRGSLITKSTIILITSSYPMDIMNPFKMMGKIQELIILELKITQNSSFLTGSVTHQQTLFNPSLLEKLSLFFPLKMTTSPLNLNSIKIKK